MSEHSESVAEAIERVLRPAPRQAVIATVPGSDLRREPRYRCPRVRVARFVAKPTYTCFLGYVRDVSLRGICLRCPEMIPAGNRLAIDWNFFDPRQHRTILARVAHVTLAPDQMWLIGCEFQSPLTATDVASLLNRNL